MSKTIGQFDSIIEVARKLFVNKSLDYGPSWRVLRSSSLTDQLYIKAARIRSLEMKAEQKIDEGIEGEFLALINYSVMGILQLAKGIADVPESFSQEELKSMYDEVINEVRGLLQAKNHDYGEAWRMMRISSFTDLILVKLLRLKQMEQNDDGPIVSEGPKSNYQDILNYAVFALIKLNESGKFKIA